MSKIKVYGDYGYVSERLLHETDTVSAATRWVERYIDGDDFGGYNIIEVAEFATDGEFIAHRRWNQEDYADQDEGILFDEC